MTGFGEFGLAAGTGPGVVRGSGKAVVLVLVSGEAAGVGVAEAEAGTAVLDVVVCARERGVQKQAIVAAITRNFMIWKTSPVFANQCRCGSH